MTFQPGDRIEDLSFFRSDGNIVRLSEISDRPLLLIFLRHLAWLLCQQHLVEVHRRQDEIRQLGGAVVVISFVSPERLSKHLQAQTVPFPAFADPDRAAYHAFGLGRGSVWRVAGWRTLLGYFRLLVRGWLPRRPTAGDDVLQMGGDFILDRDNRLRYAHPSRDPSDRPSADEVVKAMRAAA